MTTTSPAPSESYLDRRSRELRDRYTGTRARRQKMAEQLLEASQYRLMLVKFQKHRPRRKPKQICRSSKLARQLQLIT